MLKSSDCPFTSSLVGLFKSMVTSAGWFWEIHPLLGGKERSHRLKGRRGWKWSREEISCHFLHNQAVLFLLFHPETRHRVQCVSVTHFHIKPTTRRITIPKDVQIRVNHLPENQCIQELRESPFLPIVILIAGLLTRRRRRSNLPLVDDICKLLLPLVRILHPCQVCPKNAEKYNYISFALC